MDYTQQPQTSHYAAPPTYYPSSTTSGAIIGPISNPIPNPNPSFDQVPISVAQGIDASLTSSIGYGVSQYPPATYASYQPFMSSATGPAGPAAAYVGPMPTVGTIRPPGKKKKASNGVTAQDLEAKKQKLIETGADVNSIRTCTLCNVVCNNDTVFAFHIASAKHISRVNGRPCKGLAQRFVSEQAAYSANISATKKKVKAKQTTVPGAVQTPTVAQSVYCDICKITCNTQEMYNNHVLGKKHNKNIKNLTACDRPNEFVPARSSLPKTQTSGTNDSDKNSVYCDICKITCNTLEMYSIHVSGKKHNKKIKNLTVGDKPIQSVPATSISPGTQTPATIDNDQEQQKPATNDNDLEQQTPATNDNGQEQQTPATNDNDQEQQTPATNDNDQEHQAPATTDDQEHAQMERKRKMKRKSLSKEDLEVKKRKMLESGAKGDLVKVCDLCNVVCNAPTVFEDHCNGHKHRNMVKRQEDILGGSAVAPVVVSSEMASSPAVISAEMVAAPVVVSSEMASSPAVISAEMAAAPVVVSAEMAAAPS